MKYPRIKIFYLIHRGLRASEFFYTLYRSLTAHFFREGTRFENNTNLSIMAFQYVSGAPCYTKERQVSIIALWGSLWKTPDWMLSCLPSVYRTANFTDEKCMTVKLWRVRYFSEDYVYPIKSRFQKHLLVASFWNCFVLNTLFFHYFF